MARALAALVTLSLVHTAVSMLHSVQAFCAAKRYVRGLHYDGCVPGSGEWAGQGSVAH